MILAQNWPKTAKSSWHCSLKYSSFIVKAVLEKDKEKAVKESVTLKASVTTLTAKVETLNKNIAQQKETEKELQVQ